jgi:hypothetical protein
MNTYHLRIQLITGCKQGYQETTEQLLKLEYDVKKIKV